MRSTKREEGRGREKSLVERPTLLEGEIYILAKEKKKVLRKEAGKMYRVVTGVSKMRCFLVPQDSVELKFVYRSCWEGTFFRQVCCIVSVQD